MKKWADKKRRHVEFKEGDLVLVKLLPQQFKSLRKVHKGLVRKYEGPFEVIKRIGKVSYKLHLPPKLKIRPIFHVTMLKPFQEDEEDLSRGVSHRAPTTVVTSFDKKVDEILADRVSVIEVCQVINSISSSREISPIRKPAGSPRTYYGNSRTRSNATTKAR
ncbi:hypothetical protein ACLB2K_020664 [Fragaria x ananassa]